MANSSGKTPTKKRILLAAERLFAERGLEGTSLRDITEAAKTNSASIHYHFGSKDALISAVFLHRLAPLSEAQLAMLDAAEAEAGDQPPRLEAVMEALVHPIVAQGASGEEGMDAFMRLMGRCINEPPPQFEKHIRPNFEPVKARFDAAVSRCEPELTDADIVLRMIFVQGGLHQILHMWGKQENGPPEQALLEGFGEEDLVRQIVSFAAAVIRSKPR
ncbi:MAG: TetR/AcrR family transcriptional regulator [Syntrophobacteraceae bacterium]